MLEAVREQAGAPRRAALDQLLAVYWKPVYKYVRLKWNKSPDDAEDLTQSFFAALLERDWLARFDPGKAKFRTYLRLCIDGHAGHEYEASKRLKRSGAHEMLSLDFPDAERELAGLAQAPDSLEDYFHREWQRQMFALAVADLRSLSEKEEKQIQFAVFEAYDLAESRRPTYGELAARHGIPETQVTNYLAWARRELRRLVLARLERVTATDQEFREDARGLLGES